jgi:hypothetical protein
MRLFQYAELNRHAPSRALSGAMRLFQYAELNRHAPSRALSGAMRLFQYAELNRRAPTRALSGAMRLFQRAELNRRAASGFNGNYNGGRPPLSAARLTPPGSCNPTHLIWSSG